MAWHRLIASAAIVGLALAAWSEREHAAPAASDDEWAAFLAELAQAAP